MENSLVITNQEVGVMIPPEETLEIASRASKALQEIVSKKAKPVIMNGEQYLEYEDLQLLGQFYGYTVKTGDAVLVEIDGVKGAKAHADLVNFRTGEIIGGAEAYCMRDEEKWNTRPKYEWQGEGQSRKRVQTGVEVVPWFQLASMAQTRAGAKAFRNRLAWVVVLAGYRPTPAEEMSEGTVSQAVKERRTVNREEHYCVEHDINYFMKGKMKAYAHPIGNTGEWCHEHAETTEPNSSPEKPAQKELTLTQQLNAASKQNSYKKSEIQAHVQTKYVVQSLEDLTDKQFKELISDTMSCQVPKENTMKPEELKF